jgi:hypothetical protein
MMMRRANHMVMSQIYLTASMSGFVTFKNKDALRGWLADIENEDRFGDVKVSPDAIRDKISFSGGK